MVVFAWILWSLLVLKFMLKFVLVLAAMMGFGSNPHRCCRVNISWFNAVVFASVFIFLSFYLFM